MTTLREVAEAIMEQLKGGWVCESDPVAQDLKAALAEPVQEPVQEPFALPCPTPKACREHCCSGHCIPPAAPVEPVQEPVAKYSDIVSDGGMDPRNKYDTALLHHDEWTDADADAARLAMELEALLLSCKDTAAVSRWWDSAHDALELHRQRLSMDGLANQQKTSGSPCPTCEALARAVMMDQTGKA